MKVETARGAFEVREQGAGEDTVVLLHPLALNGGFWAPIADFLGTTRRVLALDARGHGDSDWDGGPFSVEDLGDDVAAILDALGVPSVDVVGMSMGGCTAIALATRHPEKVNSLVLADTTACYGPEREARWQERAEQAVEKSRPDQIAFQLDRWFSSSFLTQRPDEVQRVVDTFLSTRSEVHAQACLALGGFDGRDGLSAIDVPTQIFVGEADQATPVAMAEELAAGIPGSFLEVLASSKHFSLLERRDIWTLLVAS